MIDLSLAKLGTWGCPWHGLIQGGQLALPNEETMTMRQPAGLPFEQGNTHLIALPTAPVTERTEDQEEADELAGRQWLNKALIAGDQIHGTSIGQGSWIYHDDDGANWLVTTTLQNAAPPAVECTVTLKRFGIFGGEPESYVYTVAVPGLDASRAYWSLASANVRARMYSAHPQGHGAIFAVLGKFTGVEDWRPIAWQQLTLSGAASDCTVAVTLLHDAAETFGTIVSDDNGNFTSELVRYDRIGTSEVVDTTIGYPTCSGNYTATESYTFGPSSSPGGWFAFPGSGYSQRRETTDCIVAVLYEAEGGLATITLDAECDWYLVASPVTPGSSTDRVYSYDLVSAGGSCAKDVKEATPGELTASQTVTSTAVAALTYKVNGETAVSHTASFEAVRTGQIAFYLADFPEGGATTSVTYSYDWHSTRSDGESASASESVPALGGEPLGSHARGLTVAADLIRQAWILSQGDVYNITDLGGYLARAWRHSNAVFGFEVDTNGVNGAYPHEYELTDQVATPAGAVTVPALTYTRASSSEPIQFAYGSFNPLTGAAARVLNTPVCWT